MSKQCDGCEYWEPMPSEPHKQYGRLGDCKVEFKVMLPSSFTREGMWWDDGKDCTFFLKKGDSK